MSYTLHGLNVRETKRLQYQMPQHSKLIHLASIYWTAIVLHMHTTTMHAASPGRPCVKHVCVLAVCHKDKVEAAGSTADIHHSNTAHQLCPCTYNGHM